MATVDAAGLLIVARDTGRVLLLLRAEGGDAGEWSFPGGRLEAGETPLEAALRELREECGDAVRLDAEPVELMTREARGVRYVTFGASCAEEAAPELNDEHDAYCWADVADALDDGGALDGETAPPQYMNLHPGARAALRRLTADELGVARMMRDGEIAGPQKAGGFTMFNVRVTGTGLAYRAADVDESGKVLRSEEYVWRDPAFYLDDDFLARCNGLPLIWEHPAEKPRIDGDEFRERVVGTVFLPYVRGDEVWAVVKVWDEAAAELMKAGDLSTSPGVMVKVLAGDKVPVPGGAKLLHERRPYLLDHLAVCERGVWDKGGEPRGVEGETPRHDALGARLDALAEHALLEETERLARRLDHAFQH